MISEWKDVQGELTIEFYRMADGNHGDVWEDDPLPACLEPYCKSCLADGEHGELVIRFNSSGYYDPGSMYGGPDQLGWAPEGDDERVITDVFIELDDETIPVDEADWPEIDEKYRGQIDETELG